MQILMRKVAWFAVLLGSGVLLAGAAEAEAFPRSVVAGSVSDDGRQSPRRLDAGRPLVFGTTSLRGIHFPDQLLRGFELWRDWANARGGIQVGNNTHPVELFVVDYAHDPRNFTLLAEIYASLIANTSIDFLLGSHGSSSTQPEPLAVFKESPKVAMLSAALLSSPIAGSNTFSVLPDNDHEWDSTLRMLYMKGARTISFVTDILGFGQLESVRYLTQTSLSGMHIISEHVIDAAFFPGSENQVQFAELVASLQELDSDIVILSVLRLNLVGIFDHMFHRDFFPKAFVTTDGNIQGMAGVSQNMSYMIGTAQWFADIVTPVDDSLGMMGNLSQYIAEVGQDCAHKWVAIGAASGLILQLAIEAGGSLDAASIRYEMAQFFHTPTFYGVVDFDKDHRLQRSALAVQYADEALCEGTCGACSSVALPRSVVVPFEAASADMVWPAPDFSERRCLQALQGARYTRANRSCECPPLTARVPNTCQEGSGGHQPPERCLELLPGHESRLIACDVIHTRCSWGHFSPGALECTACPVGYFADGAGFTVCEACQPGRVAAMAGSSTCTACGQAEFANASGQSACAPCPGGTLVTSGGGATSEEQCAHCELGFVLDNGVCSACPMGYTTSSASSEDCTLADGTIVVIALSAASVVISSLIMYTGFRMFRRRVRLLEERAEAAVNATVSAGLKSSRELGHPLVIISMSNFLNVGKSRLLVFHEDARAKGLLTVIDTLAGHSKFAADGNILVFFSYQRLSWSRAGPSPKQWRCMREAINEYVAMKHLDISKVYLWLDVLSIPQKHPVLKRMAINSLYVFAKCSNSIIVISPTAVHCNTQEKAGLETYASRVWCRVELLARSCGHGAADVYIKQDCTLEQADDQWLKDIANVFDGEMTCCRLGHENGTTPCDKESLVVPLCGMYFEKMSEIQFGHGLAKSEGICRVHRTSFITDVMKTQKDAMFPTTFRYRIGTAGETVEKPLFGDIIDRIDRSLMEGGPEACAGINPTPIARCMSHNSIVGFSSDNDGYSTGEELSDDAFDWVDDSARIFRL